MKLEFSKFIKTNAPMQLKVLFKKLDDSQAIMLETCFHQFAKTTINDFQNFLISDGQLDIQADEAKRNVKIYCNEL